MVGKSRNAGIETISYPFIPNSVSMKSFVARVVAIFVLRCIKWHEIRGRYAHLPGGFRHRRELQLPQPRLPAAVRKSTKKVTIDTSLISVFSCA